MDLEDPERMAGLRWLWLYWLATFRVSHYAVCVMSQGRGVYNDFHDYHDTEEKFPDHFADLTCERCGKKFMI